LHENDIVFLRQDVNTGDMNRTKPGLQTMQIDEFELEHWTQF